MYQEGRLKIEATVREVFRREGILPVTKDKIKAGVPPVIDALRFVLAAYYQRPFRNRKGGAVGFSNWSNRHGEQETSYEEWYANG